MKRDGRYQWGVIASATIIFEVLSWVIWLLLLGAVGSYTDILSAFGGGGLLVNEASPFRFARPWMLWAMPGLSLLLLLYLIDLAWKNRALARFADATTRPRMIPRLSGARSLFRFLALRHGLSFVAIALAGPQFGTRLEEVKAKGVDLMVALDVSNSMLCEDLPPSRIETARRALAQLIDQLHGDRLGIVVFAGDAYVQLPITTDRSAAQLFLGSVGTGMVPTQGTAIGRAIELSMEAFDASDPTSKAIIVISDGENHEDDGESAARKAAEAGITVSTIGMGSPEGGPLPIRQGGQITGYKKDKDGTTVVSRLDEAMLQRIAAAGNGQFVRATPADTGIGAMVAALRQLDQHEIGTYRYAGHEDRFRLFLAIGCALIFASLFIGERGTAPPKWMTLNA